MTLLPQLGWGFPPNDVPSHVPDHKEHPVAETNAGTRQSEDKEVKER